MRRIFLLVSVAIAILVFLALALVLMREPRSAIGAPALLPEAQLADDILIEKSARKMTLFRKGIGISTFSIRLGFSPKGTKQQEGDGKTPDGTYRIDRRNPHSTSHLSLGINYPTAEQRKAAQKRGVSPGGDIFIHGQPNALRRLGITLPFDWTEGCIAVSNAEMDDIFARVAIGTTIRIVP